MDVVHVTQHKEETQSKNNCRVLCSSIVFPNNALLYVVILSVVIIFPRFPSVLTRNFLIYGFELDFVSNSYESLEN